MPHQIGYVDNSGGTLAHYKFLTQLRDFASANGWTVLRYDDTIAERELILRGPGMTGTEEIFVGWKCIQNADADYYNMLAGVFTGYVPSSPFASQPSAAITAFCAHNQRIDYWLTLNGQRIAFALKLGTPVYETCYVGKFLPYARPSQYPYPVVCAGTLASANSTLRFSDISTNHRMPWIGNHARMRSRSPTAWGNPLTWPWSNNFLTGTSTHGRDTDGAYPLSPIVLHSTTDIWGELDGIFHVTGFNIVVEDTFELGGLQHVAIQNIYLTGFPDYFAIRMDA